MKNWIISLIVGNSPIKWGLSQQIGLASGYIWLNWIYFWELLPKPLDPFAGQWKETVFLITWLTMVLRWDVMHQVHAELSWIHALLPMEEQILMGISSFQGNHHRWNWVQIEEISEAWFRFIVIQIGLANFSKVTKHKKQLYLLLAGAIYYYS